MLFLRLGPFVQHARGSMLFCVGGGFPFKVSLTGYSGHLKIEPLPPVYRENGLSNLPNFILVSSNMRYRFCFVNVGLVFFLLL